jgi:hypothetical protein
MRGDLIYQAPPSPRTLSRQRERGPTASRYSAYKTRFGNKPDKQSTFEQAARVLTRSVNSDSVRIISTSRCRAVNPQLHTP